jgi:CheY-like chemotaxis protein
MGEALMTDHPTTTALNWEAVARKRAGQSFAVLVIDDNPADRRLTSLHLDKAWPFEHDLALDYAADGAEAIEKVWQSRYALLVLDWKMPTVGGHEVLRRLREEGIRTPVVIVSDLEWGEIPDDLGALGAAFLNKGQMNSDTLRNAIAQSLRLLGFVSAPAPPATIPIRQASAPAR